MRLLHLLAVLLFALAVLLAVGVFGSVSVSTLLALIAAGLLCGSLSSTGV